MDKTDDYLRVIGSFGKYQRIVVILIILPAILPSAFHSFNQMFLTAVPEDYWCKIHPDIEAYNLSQTQIALLLPKDNDSRDNKSHSKCEMWDIDYAAVINFSSFVSVLENFDSISDKTKTRCRYGYQYSSETYTNTIATDWDLVCDKGFYPTLAMVLLSVGEVVGTPIFGYLSDQIGRKPSYLICFFVQLVFGVATAFAPDFITFCIFRVVVGGTYGAIYSLPFILGLEIVGPDHRATVSVLTSVTYSIGNMLLAGIAYLVRDWKHLALLTSAPLVIIGISWCFVPESPRWLLAKGRVDEAKDFFRRASKLNGVELEPHFLDDLTGASKKPLKLRTADTGKRHTFIDLFRTPNLRKNTLLLTFVNFGNLAVYTGLSYYAPTLSPIPHLSFFLLGLVELPGYLFVQFTADRYGRRLPQISCMIIGGIACILAVAVPDSAYHMYIAFCLTGKLLINISYLIAELMEGELIPTVIRSEGSAFTEIVASALTTCVPIIVYLGYNYLALPLIIFGVLACVAGICAFFLPETFDADLPETILDGENLGKNYTFRQRFNLFPQKRKRLPEHHGAVNSLNAVYNKAGGRKGRDSQDLKCPVENEALTASCCSTHT
ncbi:carcinine transporter-like [Paramacrobiotus metropolitanus]|uniref:carcinine transporter-like n=1 Tax=Paramacrobiotus metropolitanus TaxID=2943436 RepID=UPI00244612C9|nr:carcinine transporter-like [Paramacrobiotus metropolitanus]XP_055338094.1 carcinine transporter-like [Paramacrobiotus metropolitanus]